MAPRQHPRILALALGMVLTACGGGTEPTGGVASVELHAATRTLQVGDTLTLEAVARDAGGADLGLAAGAFAWSSSRPAVATVDAAGRLTALAADTVTVTAAASGHSARLGFTFASVPAAAVALAPDTLVLAAGRSAALTLLVTDAGGRPLAGRTAAWTSSDTTLVRVSPNGAVTAIAIGHASITAVVEGKRGAAHVEVTPMPVASVRLEPTGGSVAVHDTLQLTATTLGEGGVVLPNRPIAWTALDAHVTLLSGGRVVGAHEGTSRVVATAEEQADTVAVQVTPAHVASVVVTPSSATIAVYGTVQLAAVAKGAAGETLAGRAIAWSTLDPALASVNDGTVTGKAAGTARVVAASEGKADTARVTVTPPPVVGVSVTPDSSDVGVGQSRQLAVTLTDEAGNTLTGRTVTWSSPDTTIVAVTSSGLARGHNSGTVTITATSEGKQGTARVRVPPSDSVTLASLTNVTYCTGRLSSGAVKSLQMDVLYPSRAVPAPLPVAIWVHGGAWAGDNISGPLYPAIRDELLKRGYAVVPIHYRTSGSGTGYGPKPWPAPLEDAKCAVRHLRANAAAYHIDPDRIGAWGHSAGGHIVAALATVPSGTFEGTGGSAGFSSRVQAVAALAPATDITRPGEIPGVDAATMQAEFPALPDSTATSIIEASPVHWASAGDTPMLLVHGDADAVIDDVQSIRLDSALTAAGVPSTFVIAHGADHSFTITSSMPTPSQIVQRVADFLDSLLK